MLDSHYFFAERVEARRFFAQQSQVKWLTISYVNKETHSDSNITTPVIVKNIICNNPNRDCNNFFTTITKLSTYFHDFIQIKRLFYNHFTQITDYASVYNIRKLNVTIYKVFPWNVPKKWRYINKYVLHILFILSIKFIHTYHNLKNSKSMESNNK